MVAGQSPLFSVKIQASLDFTLYIMRHNRHRNNLAMAMGNAGTGSFAEIFKDKNVFDARILSIQCLHTIPIDFKNKVEVLFAHLMECNSMVWVVDDNLMMPISRHNMLHPGRQARGEGVVVKDRVKVFNNSDIPFPGIGKL